MSPSCPSPNRLRPRRRRPKPLSRRMARHTPLFEVSARLAVNGLITVVSLSALGQLVPYIQAQSHRLEQVNHAVDTATTSDTQRRAEFSRYFSPAQASRTMQEYSGYQAPHERQVVWTEVPQP